MPFARLAAAVCIATVCFGCDPVAPTGNGATFTVLSTQTLNTCGPQSIPAPAHLQFDVQLRVATGAATWTVASNGAMAQGSWDPSSHSFEFVADSQSQLRAANQWLGIAACVVRRLDIVSGVLSGSLPSLSDASTNGDALDAVALDALAPLVPVDSGAPPSFTASETITIGPIMGADCSDQIGASEGQFSTLPCQITYAMSGTVDPDAGVAP